MSFELCCDKREMVGYDLIHQGHFSSDVNLALLSALWNLPEIQSYQSNENTVFSNDVYDEFLMSLLKEKLCITDSDISVSVGKEAIIDSENAMYYEKHMCINCSKILFHKRSKKTMVNEFFNHLRNSVAHGCFNIVDGMFIGFDHPKFHGEKWSAVLKIKYNNLAETITTFCNLTSISDIYRSLLGKLGYRVSVSENESILATKDGYSYLLVIRHYEGRYLNQVDVETFFNEYRKYNQPNSMLVLVVDSTYITKETKLHFVNQNIAVIDKNSLKEMIKGVDYLKILADEHSRFMTADVQ